MDRDGLGTLDTVMDRVGRKMALGRTGGNEKMASAPQKPLESLLGKRLEML
jgi:hypothetical protein